LVKKDRYVAIFFNTEDQALSEKSFRQALAYAIKKPWPARAISPINPDSWAYNPEVKPYDYDLENARNLLAKTREEIPEDQQVKEIELATISSLLPVAEEIGRNWEELGITTHVKVLSSLDEGFQALLVTQEIPADPDQYTLWHSTQKTNLSRYQNPKIDKLLEDGRRQLDQADRKQIYLDFQKAIVEETSAIFLFHPTLYTVERQ
jgi:peptide/nickel transport system substrate-binding protein